MVQFFGNSKNRSGYLVEALAPALGQGLGELTGSYFANKSLDKVLNDPSMKDAPVSERLSKLQSALSPYGDRGQRMFQSRLGIEQQRLSEQELARSKNEQSVLARVLSGQEVSPEERGALSPESQLKLLQHRKNLDVSKNLEENLKGRGVAPEVAKSISELYRDATEGGKTEILKNFLDLESRGLLGQGEGQPISQENTQQIGNKEPSQEFQWPELQKPKGLKPSDTVKREGDREKVNIPLYNETNQKLKGIRDEGMSIKRMIQLNETGKLPSGSARLFIDSKSGELAFPAGTNPETQLFVKTLNDFTTKAKDSYGSRVTNFDLDQFMKRLPSLANTMEGRRLILKQMDVINKLNALDSESLKKAYDHYGVGRINAQEARQFADAYKENKEKPLLEEYENLGGLLDQKSEPTNTPEKGFVRMQNPQNGEIWDIPEEDAKQAAKDGWLNQ